MTITVLRVRETSVGESTHFQLTDVYGILQVLVVMPMKQDERKWSGVKMVGGFTWLGFGAGADGRWEITVTSWTKFT